MNRVTEVAPRDQSGQAASTRESRSRLHSCYFLVRAEYGQALACSAPTVILTDLEVGVPLVSAKLLANTRGLASGK